MKILLYISSMQKGGAERVMSNLANYFAQKYEVILINDFPTNATDDVYEVDNKVKREYLRDTLKGNPVIKNIQRIMRLRQILKDEKPDVALSFLGLPNYRMLLASIGLHCKKFVSVRNDPNREYGASNFRKWLARKIFTLADGVVFQTKDAAVYFTEAVQARSTIIMNPVGDAFYKEKWQKDNCRNIIAVGRLEPQKNHALLIKAWSKIEKEFPSDKLVIYGEGKLRTSLEKQIAELNIEERVKLPGVISDVPKHLAEAKAYVLSSDYEGLPNSLMEALTVGVPSVSSSCPCGGPQMLIEHEKNGLLVLVGDVEGLTLAIRKLLHGGERVLEMSEAARAMAKEYAYDNIMKKWEEYLGVK